MQEDRIKVPKDRIAILIGKGGRVRKRLEEITKTKIRVYPKEEEVVIQGESINIYEAKPIVRAIARGFNPKVAELLASESYTLEVIELKDFSGDSKKKMIRLKSRLIGTSGKCRINLEKMTHCYISVYGKTVSIIGKVEDILYTKSAIEYLLLGAPHGRVYKYTQEALKK